MDEHQNDPVVSNPGEVQKNSPSESPSTSPSIAELARSFDTLKSEVDAIQVTLMKQHGPWYRNASTIIAVLALLFSFSTTFVSYRRTSQQDMQNTRIELRNMLQRLASLPKENFEVTLRHADNPLAAAAISGYINQENTILARQAAELASNLPHNRISATEYYAVAQALMGSYNFIEAREFLQLAIRSANNFNDEISAIRTHAGLLFQIGQPEEGRAEYRRALGIFEERRYEEFNEYTKGTTHIMTELSWAYAEAGAGFAPLAGQHLKSAERYLSLLAPGPATEQWRSQIGQAKQLLTEAALDDGGDFEPLPISP